MWIVCVHIVFHIAPKVKVWGVHVWQVWSPLWVTPPTDEAIREALPKPIQRVVLRVRSGIILLKPSFGSNNTSLSAKSCPKLS